MNDKLTILQDAGFKEMPERMMWIARDRRQAFSEDTISDHDEKWLKNWLARPVPETEFRVHLRFVSDASIEGCNEILARMQLATLTPIIRSGIRRAN